MARSPRNATDYASPGTSGEKGRYDASAEIF